jgi:hypothetical protein
MSRFRPVIIVLVFSLVTAGCNLLTEIQTPPTLAPTLNPTEVPSPIPTGLTLDALKNAEYTFDLDEAMPTFRLSDGSYQSGSDPSKSDFVQVNLADKVAFGDLNGDGVNDAAVVISINTGGTGEFEYVVGVVSQDGQPMQAGYAYIDDRAIINSLNIADGKIILDTVTHAPNDPMCCPSQPVIETLRLPVDSRGILWLTHFISKPSSDTAREITITSPAPGTGVDNPFTIIGNVTIAPFENSLVYHVYDMNLNELSVGPLMVNAPDMGAPGTFELTLDLSTTGYKGPIFVTISDLSMADGSILAMDSVILVVK